MAAGRPGIPETESPWIDPRLPYIFAAVGVIAAVAAGAYWLLLEWFLVGQHLSAVKGECECSPWPLPLVVLQCAVTLAGSGSSAVPS